MKVTTHHRPPKASATTKRTRSTFVTALALSFSLSACMPSSEPPPTPSPTPVATAAPAPTPTPTPIQAVAEPQFDDYMDGPQSPGTWKYATESSETLAVFGTDAATPDFIIRCDLQSREIGLARRVTGGGSRAMRIQTETTERPLTANAISGRPLVAAVLSARDPLLDAMAITKGRFAVSVEGARTLYIPAWTEVTRVIEDCR